MSKPREKKSLTVKLLRVLLILLATGCAAVGALLIRELKAGPSASELNIEELRFAPGISVMNIALEGKTLQEARTLLGPLEREMAAKVQFVLDAGTESLTLTQAEIKPAFNTEDVLSEAIKYGNIGSLAEKRAQREALEEEPKDFPLDFTLDVEAAKDKLIEFAQRIKKEPIDASVAMDLSVADYFIYTDGVPGEKLDVEALLEELKTRADAHEYGEVELPIVYEDAEITVESLKATLVRRSKAETSFKKSPYNRADRVFNVKKAAALVNGFVLKPGEVFSTNDTLGPRTYEGGWKPAPAIVQGTTEDQAGGGVCQVSTTLYNAVVKADLEIVSRRNHSSPISYITQGLDATIDTGRIDFQFKNNTESDIYLFAYAIDKSDGPLLEGQEDKTLHIEIFGAPLPDEYDEIKLTSSRLETLYPSGDMEIIVDSTVAWDYYEEQIGRKNGSIWQSYKHYYKNGVEVKKELLAKSTYKAYNGKIVVGQGYFQQPPITPQVP